MNHCSGSGNKTRLADMVASFLLIHGSAYKLGHIFVAAASLHQCCEIVLANGKQACTDLSI
jgi:hypothetical protein